MAWTFVQKNQDENGGGSGSISSTGNLTWTNGSLVVVAVRWEDSTKTLSSVDLSGQTFTLLTNQSVSNQNLRMAYRFLTAGVATTNIVATFSGSTGGRAIQVYEYTPPVGAAFDTENASATATSTSLATGNITTTTTDELVVAAFAFRQDSHVTAISSQAVNGVAADQTNIDGDGSNKRMASWTALLNATFTSNATGTANGSNELWIANIAAFGAASAPSGGGPLMGGLTKGALIRGGRLVG